MMNRRLLDILCCPATRAPLRELSIAELAALNAAIATNGISDASGTRVGSPYAAGLITCDRRLIYRIEDDIPIMLADESVAVSQIEAFPAS